MPRPCDKFDWPLEWPRRNLLASVGPEPHRLEATEGTGVKLQIVLTNLAHYTAPLRRFGASSLGRMFVLAIGLAAMTAFTVSDLQKSADFWLSACLWCCLAYFAVEGYVRAQAALQAGKARNYLLSASGIVDLVAIFPVPIALA